jgi:hypothetical protein
MKKQRCLHDKPQQKYEIKIVATTTIQGSRSKIIF